MKFWKTSAGHFPAMAALTVGLLLAAFLFGRLSVAGHTAIAQDASPAASTATREAELAEINALRTQIAQTPVPLVCTPAATSTPEPSPTATPSPTVVPPVQAGVPVPYDKDWTVTVIGVDLVPTYYGYTADGIYADVSFIVVNNTDAGLVFPYRDLILLDEQGRVYFPDSEVGFVFESNWIEQVPPTEPLDRFLVFDILREAKGPFILESTTDPTFRVQVEVEVRG